jgi:DNA polymerase III subunit epsilon
MNFVSLDVETANSDFSSICQIGIARFENGLPVEQWSSLVDPEDYFDGFNISIHGIDEQAVRGAPTFPDVAGTIRAQTEGRIVVCHTHFDRVATAQACSKYGLGPLPGRWLDSARVARRAWTQIARRGYGLDDICEAIGYKFRHHDAVEDAKAAGVVMIAAIMETGIDLAGWLQRVEQPLFASKIAQDGNPEGPLYGEILVFTGALAMSRAEAALLAAKAGCTVGEGVTKHTTILIVGDQDQRKLNGYSKSSKHRKAEDLIGKGQSIRIITEQNFQSLTLAASTD